MATKKEIECLLKFLKNKKILERYIRNIDVNYYEKFWNKEFSMENYKDFLMHVNKEYLINRAFRWSKSFERFDFWEEIDMLWKKNILKNNER